MALKTMSIDKLVKLRDQVEAALASKVTEQRRALESELSKLGRFQTRTGRGGQHLALAVREVSSHPNTATPKILTRPGPAAG